MVRELLDFQYSIGDAESEERMAPIFKLSVLSILHWRCPRRSRADTERPARLSILHWRCDHRRKKGLVLTLAGDFQYSIGDATILKAMVVRGWLTGFQYSIGDDLLRRGGGADGHVCILSILHWRCGSEIEWDADEPFCPRFQYSV